jgi:murein DD-endopeptidase MepM/ murein hydrolase activator NlpD
LQRRLAVRAITIAVVAMLGVLATGPVASMASNASRYDELQQKIRDTRARIRAAQRHERSLLAQIRESDARRSLYEGKAASLGDRLALAVAHLDALQAQVDEAAQELALVSQQLEDALARLEDQRAQVDHHAAGLYIDSTETYTTVLLGTHDFRDFVAGVEYSNRLLSTDVQFLNALNDTKEEVSDHRSTVQEKKLLLEKRQSELRAQAVEIGKLRQAQLRAAQAAAAEVQRRQRLLNGVRDQKETYIRALQQMLAESDSIEAILKGAQKGQHVVAGMGKGYLVWPTSGQITSPYGWRTHPIYGYRSFHTGIDIGAPSGQRVVAARRGEVLYTGYKDAYGLIVIIDHGNSLATVYAHLSRVYVRPGQWVSTRGVIAAVGSTGWSTGPHLHFEVRVNGDHVNPVRYL